MDCRRGSRQGGTGTAIQAVPVVEVLVTLPERYAHSGAHAEGRLKMFYDER